MTDYIYSLSEINALCRKAAKGAGLSWGQAEEVGKAATCLASYDINGLQYLYPLLKDDSTKAQKLMEQFAHLNDHAYKLAQEPLTYHDVDYPIFLLPALVYMTSQLHTPLELKSDDLVAYVDCNGVYLSEGFTEQKHAKEVSVRSNIQSHDLQHSTPTGISVSASDWKGLFALAEQYFAPATEQSRQNAGE
ncbi:MAG: DUF3726 domain-containing protein [Alphaproteobacteria bacterium]